MKSSEGILKYIKIFIQSDRRQIDRHEFELIQTFKKWKKQLFTVLCKISGGISLKQYNSPLSYNPINVFRKTWQRKMSFQTEALSGHNSVSSVKKVDVHQSDLHVRSRPKFIFTLAQISYSLQSLVVHMYGHVYYTFYKNTNNICLKYINKTTYRGFWNT